MPSRSLHCPPKTFQSRESLTLSSGPPPQPATTSTVSGRGLGVPYFRPSLGPTSGGLKLQHPGTLTVHRISHRRSSPRRFWRH